MADKNTIRDYLRLLDKEKARKEAERRAREQAEREAWARRERERDADYARRAYVDRHGRPEVVGEESEAARWVADNLKYEPGVGLWLAPYCSYSDYHGSFMSMANGQALLRDFPAIFSQSTSGHGSVSVGITEENRMTLGDHPEEYEQIKDIIEGLEDYPIIDEDLMSKLEMDAQWEDWTEYGRQSLREEWAKQWSGCDLGLAIWFVLPAALDDAFSEFSWYDDYEAEEGCTFYFRALAAVKKLPKEWVEEHGYGRLRRAKQLAYGRGLGEKFYQAVQQRWGTERPELVEALFRLPYGRSFAIFDRLVGETDDLATGWELESKNHPEDGVTASQDEIVLAASKLLDHDITTAIPEDPRQMKLNLEGRRLAEQLLLAEDEHSYSCVMILLPEAVAEFLNKWSRVNIPDKVLFHDEDGGKGRETESHVTVKYGLTDREPPEALKDLAGHTGPFIIRLGAVSLFENDEFDVVKLAVDSKGLRNLNAAITARCECPGDKRKDYVPHVTLAYVKHGTCQDLVGQNPFAAEDELKPMFEAESLVFAGHGDTKQDEDTRAILNLSAVKAAQQAAKMAMGETFVDPFGRLPFAADAVRLAMTPRQRKPYKARELF